MHPGRLDDEANIKQTSSKRQAIRAHVVHVYFDLLDVCLMFGNRVNGV